MTESNLPTGGPGPSNSGADNTVENEEVKFEEGELENVEELTSKKIKTLDAQKRHWREKAMKAIRESEDLKKQIPPPPAPNPPENKSPAENVETAARKVVMDMERDRLLAKIPSDRRIAVKDFYGSLTTGKEIGLDNIENYMEAAMRAAGVAMSVNSVHRIISNSPGSIPPLAPPGPTPEEVALAQKFGNDPIAVYGKKEKLPPDMLHAEKFFGEKDIT